MFLNTPVSHEKNFFGHSLRLETGLLAQQATSSVLASCGDTTVLAAVVVGKPTTMNFLPLQVIYEEKLYASGKIKGSRFIKREGRPTDNAILTGRLIDRSLRSLFDDTIRNDIQIIVTVLSLDEVNPPDTLSVIAASAALTIAGIEGYNGSISCVRIGLTKDRKQLIVNPDYTQISESELDLVISGNGKNIVMLEAGANIVPEDIIAKAMKHSMQHLQELTSFQDEFVNKVEKKITTTLRIPKNEIAHSIASLIHNDLETTLYSDTPKKEKYVACDTIIAELVQAVEKILNNEESNYIHAKSIENLLHNISEKESFISQLNEAIHTIQKSIVENNILEKSRRMDGRSLTEVRPLIIQTDVLPRVHGSSLFQRGETQVLNILTLGTLRDAQTLDDMEDFEETTKRYMHHYNFPAYSVGEIGRYTGPGRREIGHGALAEKALIPVLPTEEEFPYTIRLVSECLGSNGSTSMASTCASTLSLMSGGVPIKDMVAGIAMGVVVRDTTHYAILTDIQGAEDHLGDMDFKVTGTEKGVTAIQLDNKISGLTVDILTEALHQSKEARLHILQQMKAVIARPKSTIASTAPKVSIIRIPVSKIGDVIGPQGKVIKQIIADTGAEIDIEDTTGIVYIYGKDTKMSDKARSIIESLTKEYQPGDTVTGTVYRIESYGAFIKIQDSGKEGMIHISRMSKQRVNKVQDVLNIGDTVTATISEINDKGQIGLSLV